MFEMNLQPILDATVWKRKILNVLLSKLTLLEETRRLIWPLSLEHYTQVEIFKSQLQA